MSVLEFQAPEHGRVPVLVEVPHAGLQIPALLRDEILASSHALRRDADLYVDGLYKHAPEVGASLLTANFSRYVVDLNRAGDDIDPVDGGGPRLAQPRGVVWHFSTDGLPVMRKPLDLAGIRERVEQYYLPYHARLQAEIQALQSRFGFVVLVAGHSMPSAVQRGPRDITRRADIVPGTLGRTSADARVIDLVERYFRGAGLSVQHDQPYRGGFTTAHYGRPQEGVHAVQIELNRALYMDERTCEPKRGNFEELQRLLRGLVERLGQLDLGSRR